MTNQVVKRAKDIMTTKVVTLSVRDSVRTAITVLVEHKISGAPVIDDTTGAMVGLVSEYDLILAVHSVGPGLDVKDAMKTSIVSVTAETSLTEIGELMLTRKFRRLPVVNEKGEPIGIISRREILRELYYES